MRFVVEIECVGDPLGSGDPDQVVPELRRLLGRVDLHLVSRGIPVRPRGDRAVLLDCNGNRAGHLRFDP